MKWDDTLKASPKKWLLLGLALVTLALVKGSLIYYFYYSRDHLPAPVTVNCDDPVKGCQLGTFSVRFEQPPQHAKPFGVVLHAASLNPPVASFQMSKMEMVPVQYHFKAGQDGTWKTQIILPVCVTGRSDWLMTVEADGQRWRFAFVAQ